MFFLGHFLFRGGGGGREYLSPAPRPPTQIWCVPDFGRHRLAGQPMGLKRVLQTSRALDLVRPGHYNIRNSIPLSNGISI